MLTRYLVAFFILALAGVGCAAEKALPPGALGGDAVVKAIRNAKKVSVYRLKGESTKDDPQAYVTTDGPIELDAKQAAALAEIVTSPRTYEFDVAPACEPIFGVRTTFVDGDTTVDIVYCFDCNLLTVYRNGKQVGDAFFAPGRKQLVAVMKELLPKDMAIQRLE